MKRVLFVAILLVVAMSVSFSQMAYKKGDQNVSAMIGLGGVGGLYGSSTLPALSVSYDYGYNENISFGGIAGYAGSSEDFFYGKIKYSYIIIAARGAYHLDLLHNPNVDTYGGIMLGYNIVSASTEWNSGYSGFGYNFAASSSYMIFGGYVGGRYYFSPNLAVQAELGYGLGIFNIGVSYKL